MCEPTRKDIAEAYRLAIVHGIVEPRQAVAWADHVIAASDAVDVAIIDVASVYPIGPGQVASVLGRVPGIVNPDTAFRLVLVLVDEELARDVERVEHLARALYGVTVEMLPPEHPLFGVFVAIDEAFELALAGFCSPDEARAGVIDTVRAHRAASLD